MWSLIHFFYRKNRRSKWVKVLRNPCGRKVYERHHPFFMEACPHRETKCINPHYINGVKYWDIVCIDCLFLLYTTRD